MSWITVAEAAEAVGRSRRTIYNWINAGRLRTLSDENGVVLVEGRDLVEVEARVKRGRPHGSPSLKRHLRG
jgi:predicted site-specific integrase-resolvase